jgi:uncharacterized Zn finger protein
MARWFDWRNSQYVTAADRRARAAAEIQNRKEQGHAADPVVIQGSAIAKTFWGKSWCSNLEAYSDYANRMPRGRSYVRSGAVVDLQIGPGKIEAMVSGSLLYDVLLTVKPLNAAHWKAICTDCAGGIDSLVELLQGKLSKEVMDRICRQKEGLFPSPAELKLSCSCPDSARMCKHVAAVLYGIGARFDRDPELLFRLRGVDAKDLIAQAGANVTIAPVKSSRRLLADSDLSALFGLEIATAPAPKPVRKSAVKKKGATKKTGQ